MSYQIEKYWEDMKNLGMIAYDCTDETSSREEILKVQEALIVLSEAYDKLHGHVIESK